MKKTSHSTRLGILACAFSLMSGGAILLPRAFGFDEDHPKSSTSTFVDHSSFHYELVRGMAYKAGFTRDEAEIIAVACQATDLASAGFTGNDTASAYGGTIKVVVGGTERTDSDNKNKVAGPQTAYYHFPRRAIKNIYSGAYPYEESYTTADAGAKATTGKYHHENRSTCQWFVTSDTCTDEELTHIEKWAFGQSSQPTKDGQGNALPTITAKLNDKDPTTSERKLIYLGIYLHSLADSYSHEAAMQTGETRTHTLAKPYEAVIKNWHDNEEFGTDSSRTREGYGIGFTLEAGRAVYMMLCRYRISVMRKSANLDFDMRTFVLDWAKCESVVDRDDKANTLLTK